MSLNHIICRPNLSKGLEEIECRLERTSPIRHDTSKLSDFQPDCNSPTIISASFKPSHCGFNETGSKLCTRQSQRPLPWTSSPIVQTNTALVLAEPTDVSIRKRPDGNQFKTQDLVSHESVGIDDDPLCGAVQSTDVKASLAVCKDFRRFSAMDRIKRLFNPNGKKYRSNTKEVGGNALAKDERMDPVEWANTKGHRADQSKRSVDATIPRTLNKAGSDPLGMNIALEPERNRITKDWDGRDDVRREKSRNHRINVIESTASQCKQNRRHGWMSQKEGKSGESCPVVKVHSDQKGEMLSTCLQPSSTSPADETAPNIALRHELHAGNVFHSEAVGSREGSSPRISTTDANLFTAKPKQVLTQVPEPSSSRDLERNPGSEVLAARSLARNQSIENVERWLTHGYQAPRHTKSRQHLSRKSRQTYLYYMCRHRSSISSSEYAISPTDRHRCAWEHCQSEEDFGSNDSYLRKDNCGEPHCHDINIKSKKVKMSHRSHETTLFAADGTSRDGETRHLGVETGRNNASQNQSADASLSKLNPSLLQFVAELIEGLEKAKHNDSEWSTRFMEHTSTPVLPRVTNLADENLSYVSRRRFCSRSSALSPVVHKEDPLQNPNAEEPTNILQGCCIKPSEDIVFCPDVHCVGLSLNFCDRINPTEKLREGEIPNRPISLTGSGMVVHECTAEKKRTFSLNTLLDDFNSRKMDSHFPPQLVRKILPLGHASSPSLLKQCLLQSLDGKSEILSARTVIPTLASGEDVLQQEKAEVVGRQSFAQLSADGFLFYADGQPIQYNIHQQPDPMEMLEEIRMVAQKAKTLQQNTTEVLEHVINIQWKKIRSLQSALSEEHAKRCEAERKLEQLTSLSAEGGIDNDVTAKLTSEQK